MNSGAEPGGQTVTLGNSGIAVIDGCYNVEDQPIGRVIELMLDR